MNDEIIGCYVTKYFKIEIGKEWSTSRVFIKQNDHYEELPVSKFEIKIEAGKPNKLILEIEDVWREELP